MATVYQVINIKDSNFPTSSGEKSDNKAILCYSNETSKYLVAGMNTESLKIKTDDFNYVLRSKNLVAADLPGFIIEPVFDKHGYMTDFSLSEPNESEG